MNTWLVVYSSKIPMINTLLSLFLAFSLATADAWFYPDSSKPTETWRLGEAKELKWNTRYASYNIWLQQNRVTGPKGRFLVYSFCKLYLRSTSPLFPFTDSGVGSAEVGPDSNHKHELDCPTLRVRLQSPLFVLFRPHGRKDFHDIALH